MSFVAARNAADFMEEKKPGSSKFLVYAVPFTASGMSDAEQVALIQRLDPKISREDAEDYMRTNGVFAVLTADQLPAERTAKTPITVKLMTNNGSNYAADVGWPTKRVKASDLSWKYRFVLAGPKLRFEAAERASDDMHFAKSILSKVKSPAKRKARKR